jgi:hypothetical protein
MVQMIAAFVLANGSLKPLRNECLSAKNFQHGRDQFSTKWFFFFFFFDEIGYLNCFIEQLVTICGFLANQFYLAIKP